MSNDCGKRPFELCFRRCVTGVCSCFCPAPCNDNSQCGSGENATPVPRQQHLALGATWSMVKTNEQVQKIYAGWGQLVGMQTKVGCVNYCRPEGGKHSFCVCCCPATP